MVVLVVSGGGLGVSAGADAQQRWRRTLVQVLARDGAQGEVRIPDPVSVGRGTRELVVLA